MKKGIIKAFFMSLVCVCVFRYTKLITQKLIMKFL